MKLLVLVDLLVVLAAGFLWIVLRGESDSNAVNPGLRGSTPPADQVWPALSEVDGITPAFPTRDDVEGRATMLVATCAECPSGDVIGGFLGRLGEDALPEDARVVVLTWRGDQATWAKRWHIDDERFELHDVADGAPLAAVRRSLGIGSVDGAEESGIAFVHDAEGRWRSTFFAGQLDREDVAHDLAELG